MKLIIVFLLVIAIWIFANLLWSIATFIVFALIVYVVLRIGWKLLK